MFTHYIVVGDKKHNIRDAREGARVSGIGQSLGGKTCKKALARCRVIKPTNPVGSGRIPHIDCLEFAKGNSKQFYAYISKYF